MVEKINDGILRREDITWQTQQEMLVDEVIR